MLLAGDERGRTQLGNNNAYCQDNETFWLDWSTTPAQEQLLAFARRLIALRHAHPVLRRRDFFQGRPLHGAEVKDIQWLKPDGSEMTDEEWDHHYARSLGVYLSGASLNEIDRTGQRVRDDDFLILFNAHHEDVAFVLPTFDSAPWHALLDTALGQDHPDLRVSHAPGQSYTVSGRALALLIRPAATA
jgi:isoamylase